MKRIVNLQVNVLEKIGAAEIFSMFVLFFLHHPFLHRAPFPHQG